MTPIMKDAVVVRELRFEEVAVRINYFHGSDDDHLRRLGVDRNRLLTPAAWHSWYEGDYARPLDQREQYALAWELAGEIVGFSSVDRLAFGEEAFMHLHITKPDRRRLGLGTEFVRQSVRMYFDVLELRRLYCQPNAFNVAPNRTLQSAGFRYLQTYKTRPSAMNFYQTVTLWMLEGNGGGGMNEPPHAESDLRGRGGPLGGTVRGMV